LSESTWDHEQVNARRLELLLADPVTAPHGAGVLVIDDSGDRKDGTATAHVGRQWLGRLGKTDRGVVTVTTLWADERCYYPLHAMPYTPAQHFPKGRTDPAFRTKLQLGVALAGDAQAAGVAFRAVVADCAYGDQDAFRGELATAGLAFVLALKRRRGVWASGDQAPTPSMLPGRWPGVAPTIPATGPRWPAPSATDTPPPGGPPTRSWAGGARTGRPGWWWRPPTRLPCPRRPPGIWPPTCPTRIAHAAHSPHRPADLAELVRLYGIRNWIEQSYKQVKDELGWADFQVRSDVAIRRHQTLVNCAFSFCWQATDAADSLPPQPQPGLRTDPGAPPDPKPEAAQPAVATAARGARRSSPSALDSRHDLAGRVMSGAGLADPLDRAATLGAGMVQGAPPTELQALITAVTAGQALNLYTPV
jgi:hypothetical protein